MAIIASTINVHVYIKTLDNFLILSIENLFGDEVIFKDVNEFCHRTKGNKAFLQERHLKSAV